MKTIRCTAWIWYRGGAFAGFMRQPGVRSVQEDVTAALAAIDIPEAGVMPAGRTDKGVHARMQVLSFRAPATWTPEALQWALGESLPPDEVGVAAVRTPHESFHAQWSATGKEYRYRLRLSDSATEEERSWQWCVSDEQRLAGRKFTATTLAEVLKRAVGHRDFIAFHEKSSVQKRRLLASAQVVELRDGLIDVRLSGDSFARYQVRYLVGTACAVAAGIIPMGAFEEALELGTPLSGLRAPAQGLVLWEVRYDADLDPFTAAERTDAAGVPRAPPFDLETTG